MTMMTNLICVLIGAVIGAGVGVFATAMARAGKTEEPPNECVMIKRYETINEIFDTVYRCSACHMDFCIPEAQDTLSEYCPRCGAKIVGVKKMEVEDNDRS